jgi:transposase
VGLGQAKPVPARLREELVDAVGAGLRPTAAADIAGVSRVTIWRWVAAARRLSESVADCPGALPRD